MAILYDIMQKGKKKISENIGANRMLLKKSGSINDTNNVTFFLKIMQWRRLRITSSYSTKVTKMFFHCQKEDAKLKVHT